MLKYFTHLMILIGLQHCTTCNTAPSATLHYLQQWNRFLNAAAVSCCVCAESCCVCAEKATPPPCVHMCCISHKIQDWKLKWKTKLLRMCRNKLIFVGCLTWPYLGSVGSVGFVVGPGISLHSKVSTFPPFTNKYKNDRFNARGAAQKNVPKSGKSP